MGVQVALVGDSAVKQRPDPSDVHCAIWKALGCLNLSAGPCATNLPVEFRVVLARLLESEVSDAQRRGDLGMPHQEGKISRRPDSRCEQPSEHAEATSVRGREPGNTRHDEQE